MSPERERQFLISVAASDALRLELKSHLMVDRILVDRVQHARVPEAVRAAIFTQAGVATVTLVDTGVGNAGPARPAAPRGSFLSRFAGRAGLFAAAVALFGAGYLVGNGGETTTVAVNPPAAQSAPRATAPAGAGNAVIDASSSAGAASVDPTPARGLSRDASEPHTAPRLNEPRRTPLVTADPRSSAAAASPASPATPTETSATRARQDGRPSRGTGAAAPVSVDVTITHPTPEQRTTSPIFDGGK